MARRKNPKPLTLFLVALGVGAAVFGVARYAKAAKKPASKKNGQLPTGNGKKKVGKKKGTGTYSGDVTLQDAAALQFLEYKPASNAVLKFQQEFNSVNAGLESIGNPSLLPMTIPQNNKMGKDTRSALGKAVAAVTTYGKPWPELVQTLG